MRAGDTHNNLFSRVSLLVITIVVSLVVSMTVQYRENINGETTLNKQRQMEHILTDSRNNTMTIVFVGNVEVGHYSLTYLLYYISMLLFINLSYDSWSCDMTI